MLLAVQLLEIFPDLFVLVLIPSQDQRMSFVFLRLFRIHDPFHDRPRLACTCVGVFLFLFPAEKVLSSWFVACFIDSRGFSSFSRRLLFLGLAGN